MSVVGIRFLGGGALGPPGPAPGAAADQLTSWIPQAWVACQGQTLGGARSEGTPTLRGRRRGRRETRWRRHCRDGNMLTGPRQKAGWPALRRKRCGWARHVRGSQAEGGEDLPDDLWLSDVGDDPHGPVTARTDGGIELVHLLDEASPGALRRRGRDLTEFIVRVLQDNQPTKCR